MYMMDSMTDDELDGKVEISPSRVMRIARGSGQSPEHVQVLLKCHKQFEGVIKKMGKSGLMKGGDEMMNKKMQRNPQVTTSSLLSVCLSVCLFLFLYLFTGGDATTLESNGSKNVGTNGWSWQCDEHDERDVQDGYERYGQHAKDDGCHGLRIAASPSPLHNKGRLLGLLVTTRQHSKPVDRH
jgi:hypothetical protein